MIGTTAIQKSNGSLGVLKLTDDNKLLVASSSETFCYTPQDLGINGVTLNQDRYSYIVDIKGVTSATLYLRIVRTTGSVSPSAVTAKLYVSALPVESLSAFSDWQVDGAVIDTGAGYLGPKILRGILTAGLLGQSAQVLVPTFGSADFSAWAYLLCQY